MHLIRINIPFCCSAYIKYLVSNGKYRVTNGQKVGLGEMTDNNVAETISMPLGIHSVRI